MRKTALVLATVGTLGVSAVATPAPAEARGWGPAIAGGLLAGAVIGGLASSAYAWGPGYYDYGPGYYGYGPAYYGAYSPGYYAPAYSTVVYDDVYAPPAYYAPRVRPVLRSSFAYYGAPYPRWHHRWHRWHHHW